jgi:5-methylcytosine-specific restriction endonuclease McrA
MKRELIVLGITTFFVMNTYHDGKYTELLKSWKKYYQITGIAFVGLSCYLFLKKHPNEMQSLFSHASGVVKYMPIDKNSADLLTPILNMVQTPMVNGGYNNNVNNINNINTLPPQQKRMMNSGKSTKRCVSETKKKYIAAQQGWKCKKCGQQLSAWFEVDHVMRLEHGGTNHISNLEALCRECHGCKTAMENL